MPNHHTCAVATCTNHGQKTKDVKISYHRFPKDPETTAKWLSKCNRGDRNFNPQYAYICSVHFVEEDYERDLQNELLGLPTRRKLKPGSVPTVNLGKTKSVAPVGHLVSSPASQPDDLPSCSSISQVTDGNAVVQHVVGFRSKSEREKRSESRTNKKAFREIWENLSPMKKHCDKMTSTTEDKFEDVQLTMLKKERDVLKKERDALVKDSLLAKSNLQRSMAATQDLRKQNTILKNLLKAQSRKTKVQSTCGKKDLTPEEKDKVWLQKNSSQVVESLTGIFSVSQMKYLVHRKKSAGQKRVHWTTGDIAAAKVLRQQSKKVYEYLRKVGYPFPSDTTLREWTKNSFANPMLCEDELESSVAAIVDVTSSQLN